LLEEFAPILCPPSDNYLDKKDSVDKRKLMSFVAFEELSCIVLKNIRDKDIAAEY